MDVVFTKKQRKLESISSWQQSAIISLHIRIRNTRRDLGVIALVVTNTHGDGAVITGRRDVAVDQWNAQNSDQQGDRPDLLHCHIRQLSRQQISSVLLHMQICIVYRIHTISYTNVTNHHDRYQFLYKCDIKKRRLQEQLTILGPKLLPRH